MSSFPIAPVFMDDEKKHRRLIGENIQRLTLGKTNNTGLVTLKQKSETTTLSDARIGFDSIIFPIQPTTLSAAEKTMNTYVAEGSRINGSVIFTHASLSSTNSLTYRYVVIG